MLSVTHLSDNKPVTLSCTQTIEYNQSAKHLLLTACTALFSNTDPKGIIQAFINVDDEDFRTLFTDISINYLTSIYEALKKDKSRSDFTIKFEANYSDLSRLFECVKTEIEFTNDFLSRTSHVDFPNEFVLNRRKLSLLNAILAPISLELQ